LGTFYGQGTSYAAPIISGVIAASLSKGYSLQEIKKALYTSAINLGLPAHHQGVGVFDMKNFLEVIGGGAANSRSQG